MHFKIQNITYYCLQYFISLTVNSRRAKDAYDIHAYVTVLIKLGNIK